MAPFRSHFLLFLAIAVLISYAQAELDPSPQDNIAETYSRRRSGGEAIHASPKNRSHQHERRFKHPRRQKKRLLPLLEAKLGIHGPQHKTDGVDASAKVAAEPATSIDDGPTAASANSTVGGKGGAGGAGGAAVPAPAQEVEQPVERKKVSHPKKGKVDYSIPAGDLWNLLQIWKAFKRMFPNASKLLTNAKETLKQIANKKEQFDSATQ